MGKFTQLTFQKRVVIETCLNEGKSATDIAAILNVNKSTVTREVKNHRGITSSKKCTTKCICNDCMNYATCKVKSLCGQSCNCYCHGCSLAEECPHKKVFNCNRKNRFPYVCNGCPNYKTCPQEKVEYSSFIANQIAENVRSTSRQGINMTEQEFDDFNNTIKEGVEKGQSVYHMSATKQVNRCAKTIYQYIDKGYLSTKNIDLPRKVKLKKRKKLNKKYEYSENSEIDRSGRMYQDFLVYKMTNKLGFYVQMDFLGSVEKSQQQIFTLTFLPFQFVWLAVFDKSCTVLDVIKLFDDLEQKLGFEEFRNLFGTLLTDRDILFNKFEKFETSKISNEKRMRIFYCDPASSYQKANVENINGQIRSIFPKEDVIENLNKETINLINSHLKVDHYLR